MPESRSLSSFGTYERTTSVHYFPCCSAYRRRVIFIFSTPHCLVFSDRRAASQCPWTRNALAVPWPFYHNEINFVHLGVENLPPDYTRSAVDAVRPLASFPNHANTFNWRASLDGHAHSKLGGGRWQMALVIRRVARERLCASSFFSLISFRAAPIIYSAIPFLRLRTFAVPPFLHIHTLSALFSNSGLHSLERVSPERPADSKRTFARTNRKSHRRRKAGGHSELFRSPAPTPQDILFEPIALTLFRGPSSRMLSSHVRLTDTSLSLPLESYTTRRDIDRNGPTNHLQDDCKHPICPLRNFNFE